MIEKTISSVRRFLEALGAERYDIGIRNDKGLLPGQDDLSVAGVLSRIPMLRSHNARGNDIYIRPSGEHALTLLDDLSPDVLVRMERDGFAPAAIVESSPGNFQAWLKHRHVLPRELASRGARLLAAKYGADPRAADWRHFGRMPGFTNRKPSIARRTAYSLSLFCAAPQVWSSQQPSTSRRNCNESSFKLGPLPSR